MKRISENPFKKLCFIQKTVIRSSTGILFQKTKKTSHMILCRYTCLLSRFDSWGIMVMKRMRIIVLIIIILAVSSSCYLGKTTYSSSSDSTYSRATLPSSEVTTYEISDPNLDALYFSSEADMIQKIKSGIKTNPQHNLEAIEYYFRPKVLLYDAKVLGIRVKEFYLAIDYVIGSEEPKNYENLITFVWYREKIVYNTEFSESSLSSSLSLIERNMNGYSLISAGQEEPICQQVNWGQDGYEFQINAPLWFTQEDIQKMMIAEKVLIQ